MLFKGMCGHKHCCKKGLTIGIFSSTLVEEQLLWHCWILLFQAPDSSLLDPHPKGGKTQTVILF